MATTATNKQPLLVDRVLHYVIDLNSSVVAGIDVGGTNTAELIVDATSSDGAIIEDIYSIARSTEEATINLYISPASDYLRPGDGMFIGQFKSGTVVGTATSWDNMPKVLVPVPGTGDEGQFRALYLPRGNALWAARQSSEFLTDGPLLGCQGGWY